MVSRIPKLKFFTNVLFYQNESSGPFVVCQTILIGSKICKIGNSWIHVVRCYNNQIFLEKYLTTFSFLQRHYTQRSSIWSVFLVWTWNTNLWLLVLVGLIMTYDRMQNMMNAPSIKEFCRPFTYVIQKSRQNNKKRNKLLYRDLKY